jgi:MFS family permease
VSVRGLVSVSAPRIAPNLSSAGGSLGAVLAVSVAGGIVTPLLPVYATETLGASVGAVGVVVAAPLVGLIVATPIAGQATDQFGKRAPILLGLTVFAVASIAYAVITSFAAVVLLRGVAGVGSGLVVVGTLADAVDEAPAGRRGESLSIYSFATNAGGAAGPLLGGAIASVASFSAAVLASAAVAALGLVAGRRVSSSGALRSPEARFRLSHRRFIDATALLPSGVLAVGFAGAATIYTLVPLFLAQLGSSRSGIAVAGFGIAITGVRLFGRQLPDRLGHRRCTVTALLVMAAGLGTMAVVQSLAGVVLASVMVGIGHGFVYPALVSSVTSRSFRERRATALGTFTAVTHVGFVSWCVGLGVLASRIGMREAFATVGIVLVLGVTLAVRLGDSRLVASRDQG